MSGPAAGWYPDPSGEPNKVRYWNGTDWTEQVQDSPTSNPNLPVSAAPPNQQYASASASYQPSNQSGYQQPSQPGYQQPSQSGYQQASSSGYQQTNPGGYQQANPDGYQQANPNGYQPQPNPLIKDRSGMALASMILGIAGIVLICGTALSVSVFVLFGGYLSIIICGPPSLVCGILAVVFGSRSLNSARRGMAIAGMVMGILTIVPTLIMFLAVIAS
jgi:hypothetical protein